MKNENILDAIGMINEEAVRDAKAYQRPKSRNWIKWGAMAACLCLVVVGALVGPTKTPSDNTPNSVISNANRDDETTNPPVIIDNPAAYQISLRNVNVNDFDSIMAAAPLYFDPNKYDEVIWSEDEIVDYYGKELTPAYIPEELSETISQRVIVSKTGEVCMDTVNFNFYHAYDEDGTPKYTEDVAAKHGFSLTVSKIGLLRDCLYILPDNEVKSSDIGGVAVTIGYRLMTTSDNPEMAYDLYVAEFEIDDIKYQIVAEQMSLDEVVKVVASIVYGNSDIDIVD